MGIFDGADRERAGKLYDCAKVVGETFLQDMVARDLVSEHPPMLAVTIHAPDTALQLGYELVAAAYELRDDHRSRALVLLREWMREVFSRQELMKHRRMWTLMEETVRKMGKDQIPYFPPTPAERAPMLNLVEIHLNKSKETIDKIVAAVRAGRPAPLECAYEGLQASFGGRGEGPQLHRRYGALLARLLSETRSAVATV
jgi:hypothetical protein